MKKIIAAFLVLAMCTALLVSCTQNTAAPEPGASDTSESASSESAEPSASESTEPDPKPDKTPLDAVSLSYGLLSNTDLPELTINDILDEEGALQALNRGVGFGDEYKELTAIEGFVSGVTFVPNMMPSVKLLCVMEFESDANFSEYSASIKGLAHYAVCDTADPKNVYVGTNGNFLIYVSYISGEEDLGKKVYDAFMAADVTDSSSLAFSERYSSLITEKAKADEYAKITRINFFNINDLVFELPGVDASKIDSAVTMSSKGVYTYNAPHGNNEQQISIFSCKDASTAEFIRDLIKEKAESSSDYSPFIITEEGVTFDFSLDGSTLIVTTKK